jgi:hypothetical protein
MHYHIIVGLLIQFHGLQYKQLFSTYQAYAILYKIHACIHTQVEKHFGEWKECRVDV